MGKGRTTGLLAFAAGAIAAPAAGAAAVILFVGLGLVAWASRDDHERVVLEPAEGPAAEPDEGVGFEFADPDDVGGFPRDDEGRVAKRTGRRADDPGLGPRSAADRAAPSSSPPSPPTAERPSAAPPGGAPPTAASDPAVAAAEPPPVDQRATAVDPVAAAAQQARAEAAAPAPAPQPEPPAPAAVEVEVAAEDDSSWIPDTLRYFVDRGVALLTGEPIPEVAVAPSALPPRAPPAAASPADMAPADVAAQPSEPLPSGEPYDAPDAADAVDAVAAADPPDAFDAVTAADAVAAADVATPEATTPAPFSPATAPPPPPPPAPNAPTAASNAKAKPAPRTTFDELIAGGIGVMTGQGIADQAPARPKPTPTAEAGYRDDASAGPLLALDDDDEPLVLATHDAATSFATNGGDAWVEGPVSLEELMIPVTVRTEPAGLPVQVDGEARGVSPVRVQLKDGPHAVVIGPEGASSSFTVGIMENPEAWCFAAKATGGGYRQVLCD
jgi:hypothetical protein